MTYNSASVKIMRSYDYCHFEVCLGLSTEPTKPIRIEAVDDMRKEAARLVDKAVEQYKISKAFFQNSRICNLNSESWSDGRKP